MSDDMKAYEGLAYRGLNMQTQLTQTERGPSMKQIAEDRIAWVEELQRRRRAAIEQLRGRIEEIERTIEQDEAWLCARKEEFEGPISLLPETENE